MMNSLYYISLFEPSYLREVTELFQDKYHIEVGKFKSLICDGRLFHVSKGELDEVVGVFSIEPADKKLLLEKLNGRNKNGIFLFEE